MLCIKMKKYFYLIKNYLAKFLSARFPDTYQSLGKCDVLLCCHDVNRGDTLDGLPYSKLIDSVSEDLMDKGWVL